MSQFNPVEKKKLICIWVRKKSSANVVGEHRESSENESSNKWRLIIGKAWG